MGGYSSFERMQDEKKRQEAIAAANALPDQKAKDLALFRLMPLMDIQGRVQKSVELTKKYRTRPGAGQTSLADGDVQAAFAREKLLQGARSGRKASFLSGQGAGSSYGGSFMTGGGQ